MRHIFSIYWYVCIIIFIFLFAALGGAMAQAQTGQNQTESIDQALDKTELGHVIKENK